MSKLISEWRRPEILIPAQVVAEAVDADCLPADLREALIRGVSVREDVCTGMRPWLMVLGAFAAAAGGAFIAIANERRRRAPTRSRPPRHHPPKAVVRVAPKSEKEMVRVADKKKQCLTATHLFTA